MKKRILTLCVTLLSFHAFAQDAKVGCNDKAIRLQSEQLKQSFKAQGLSVTRDAMVSMESRQPYPVAIHLEKGKMYQFIYIGDRHSSRIDFELFDGEDKKLDQRALKDPEVNNFVVYSFVPDRTDIYLIILTQRWKTKSMCGSFTIMEKTETDAKP